MSTMHITCLLGRMAFSGFICALSFAAKAQYYYKDIVVTGQISANYRLLAANKVNGVTVTPSMVDPAQTNVSLKQTLYPSQKLVITYTKVPDAAETWLKSYYDSNGLLLKTVDSSADVVTTSVYEYDNAGRPLVISSNSVPVNDPAEKEIHRWRYDGNGQPVEMIKIKDNTDSTVVSFAADEQGNAGEEKAVHKKNPAPVYYYYYDAQHRITDVARYNNRAKRILPDYMFEYNDRSQVSQMIVVPEGSADYQTWKYIYNPQGLKEKDVCYNKQRQMVASIDYTYSFGK